MLAKPISRYVQVYRALSYPPDLICQMFLNLHRKDMSSSTTFSLETIDGGQNPQGSGQAGAEAVSLNDSLQGANAAHMLYRISISNTPSALRPAFRPSSSPWGAKCKMELSAAC